MPTRNPDILGLITDRIGHLEDNLTAQIHDVREDIGVRLTDLTAKVNIQNGRVNKLESCVGKLEASATPQMDKRRLAILGTGGIVGGAGLIEIIKWLGEALHKTGLLG